MLTKSYSVVEKKFASQMNYIVSSDHSCARHPSYFEAYLLSIAMMLIMSHYWMWLWQKEDHFAMIHCEARILYIPSQREQRKKNQTEIFFWHYIMLFALNLRCSDMGGKVVVGWSLMFFSISQYLRICNIGLAWHDIINARWEVNARFDPLPPTPPHPTGFDDWRIILYIVTSFFLLLRWYY